MLRIDRKMCRFSSYYVTLVVVLGLGWVWETCDGSGFGFGFDIHHRFSEPVRAMLKESESDLPEIGTVDFYTSMAHRDRIFHSRRRLSMDKPDDFTTLTFVHGNLTLNYPALGFLYYANVSVGTPASWYLVALDTGSGLFWLPCDCTANCTKVVQVTPSLALELNTYSLKASSSGKQLSCYSPLCMSAISCSSSQINCPYSISYLSENTSSTGYLVEDVLHLTTDANSTIVANPRIAFGCGVRQTGSLLDAAAPTGLLGLSMDDTSVPSMLADMNLISNSFSMCFTKHGIGRISFGDKGSSDQSETPFIRDPFDLYNISITQVSAGTNVSATPFTAFFDTGTSFTLLADPAYTVLSDMFDSQVKDQRLELDSRTPFKYCYLTSLRVENMSIPAINLTMEGGDQFTVKHPAVVIPLQDGTHIYCLGVVKSSFLDIEEDVNIIGENFMTGYRVVFDREKMVVGWKASNCDEAVIPGTRPRSSDVILAAKHHPFLIIITLFVQIVFLDHLTFIYSLLT